jgi:hypothetical protein
LTLAKKSEPRGKERKDREESKETDRLQRQGRVHYRVNVSVRDGTTLGLMVRAFGREG